MKTKKSFVGLEQAYAFFREHSTQLREAAKAIAAAVERETPSRETLRLCFSGCGDPEIAVQMVETLRARSSKIEISLVDDHGEWLCDAARKVHASGPTRVSSCTAFEESRGPFDVVVAYHTMYYTPDLQGTLRTIQKQLARDGILVTALASHSNKLKQCAADLFALNHRRLPYWQEEDLEAALAAADFVNEVVAVRSAVSCADSPAARASLINFLMGTTEPVEQAALNVFEPYCDGVRLHVPMLDSVAICRQRSNVRT